MLSLLHELHRAGTTIAIITHDREIAAGLPRQVEMRDGRIVADSAVPVKVEGAGVTAVKPGRPALKPARLGPRDALRVSGTGLRTRPLRAFLSALGIAIGVAAMVAVVGISASSQAALDAMLAKLGTNLLTASAVDSAGVPGRLPKESVGMVRRIGSVTSVSAVGHVPGAKVYRTDKIPPAHTDGLAVFAARTDLPDTVGATVHSGTWLNAATAGYPAVVLGATTAERLGIGAAGPDLQVWLGSSWFAVVGVLDPVPLAPELDRAAIVGFPVAESRLGFSGYPSLLYERSTDDAVLSVGDVLAQTVNPENPTEVQISRPSDALAAKEAVDTAFTGLLLGLGAVALLVGGVGVANTMVISLLERRGEIGLRRALGGTAGQTRLQFLGESLLLSGLGGLAGTSLGALVAVGYATSQDWPSVVPLSTVAAGLAATLFVGAIAGLYPAVRAGRLAPTVALSSA